MRLTINVNISKSHARILASLLVILVLGIAADYASSSAGLLQWHPLSEISADGGLTPITNTITIPSQGNVTIAGNLSLKGAGNSIVFPDSSVLSSATGIGSGGGWATSGLNVYNDTAGVSVGIGTASPGYTLDVAGTLHATGNSVMNTINGGTPITSANIGSQSVNYANTAGSAPPKHYKAFASCYAESKDCGIPVCSTEPVPASCPAGYTQAYYADKDTNFATLFPPGDYYIAFPVHDTALFDAGPWAVHYADVTDIYGVVLASATTGVACGNCAICAYRVCVQN